jgi:subtilisin family serine protease
MFAEKIGESMMRLLVKARTSTLAPARIRLGFGATRAAIPLRPLMPSIAESRARAAGGLGFASGGPGGLAWFVTEPIDPVDPGTTAWDLCHQMVRGAMGVTGEGAVVLAEPDLEQAWLPQDQVPPGFAAAAPPAGPSPQSQRYPRGPADNWFDLPDFSGLAAARAALGASTPGIRIAHLDTGYDPDHHTKPRRLLEDQGLNFADPGPDGKPSPGAKDVKTAAINLTFGHGTGTLALLAGEPYGGASGFEVLPLRVANFVALFENSAIAAALDHVHSRAGDPARRCDVLSMSMGGAPSAAWAEAVNALYDAGVVLVTAAGNNFGNLPVRSIVYPARFGRVLAACGVMANGKPYADLDPLLMAGCYGPRSKMVTALSAWTPNTPWARFGAPDVVDQDGGGTSAATPQIAAAAALWLEKHAAALQGFEGWQRVEAVRQALFAGTGTGSAPPDQHLGRGILHADKALQQAPQRPAAGARQPEDSTDFAILRLLTGLGIAADGTPAAGPQQRMLELEALQIASRSPAVAKAMAELDPGDRTADPAQWREALLAIADDPGCSRTLRGLIRGGLDSTSVAVPAAPVEPPPAQPSRPAGAKRHLKPPSGRRLRVFSADPGRASSMRTRRFATTVVEVDWEPDLRPGPVGEYVEVVDIDPSSRRAYEPVDLDAPELLAQDGVEPSEGLPQFHHQMAYAVSMKTIGHFRQALGRAPFWNERYVKDAPEGERNRFVRRLRIYPHALRQPNAFYSPDKRALLLGYFRAGSPGSIEVLQGGMIFTCLSFDIVAHETTHALLDGLHPRWKEWTNRDMPAFHEAFADLMALFQHFTMPDMVVDAIRQSQGRLRLAESLGALARQFGQAVGGHGALRDAIGTPGDPGDYEGAADPHSLGAVLVAAIFDAWLQVYEDRTADLFRLATSGTGVLPAGEIPPDLALRLAEEASKLAGHFLNICIRALDYSPPVDMTFGDYLRAMITADRDLVGDDPLGYRVALVDGFRKRGIKPELVQTWSPEAMVWENPEADLGPLARTLQSMSGTWRVDSDRFSAWQQSARDRGRLQVALTNAKNRDALLDALGLLPPSEGGSKILVDGLWGSASRLEVHSVRPLRRIGPDGQVRAGVVIEITQRWFPEGSTEPIRGGCTIIWNRATETVEYVITRRVGHRRRTEQLEQHQTALTESGSSYANYRRIDRRPQEPFALLHTDL